MGLRIFASLDSELLGSHAMVQVRGSAAILLTVLYIG